LAASEVDLKIVELTFDLDKEAYLRGKNDENIYYFQDKSFVKSISIVYDKQDVPHLEVIGTEDTIETLKEVIEYHMSFYEKHH